MDETAIFKISYGLFFLGTEYEGKKNICVVNTVAQVTQEPLRVLVTMMKGGYTHELILQSGKFSVGVMDEGVNLDDVAHFGQQCGRDTDKLQGYDIKTDKLGNALYDQGCCASLCCKVIQTVDIGTHTLFIADLVDAKNLSDLTPLTYGEYRELKSGRKKQNTGAPAPQKNAWQCTICHYVYDGDIPFEDLPDDYVCPVCGKPKSAFVKM